MPTKTKPIFKKCSLIDLNAIAEISKRTFSDAFAEFNNPNDFNSYIETAFSENQLRSELRNENSFFYLVYCDACLVGYFKLNVDTAQTEFKDVNAMELERVYVKQQFQGRKIGSEIVEEVLRMARFMEKEFLWLGVWQENIKAIKFYEKHGFKKCGTHPYYIGDDKQTDWLMKNDLVNS